MLCAADLPSSFGKFDLVNRDEYNDASNRSGKGKDRETKTFITAIPGSENKNIP